MTDWLESVAFETRNVAEALWDLVVALTHVTGLLLSGAFAVLAFVASLLLWLLGGFAIGYRVG